MRILFELVRAFLNVAADNDIDWRQLHWKQRAKIVIKLLIVLSIVVAVAGFIAWQQPQVRELFESTATERQDPLAVLQKEDEELAEARARQKAEEEAEKKRSQAAAAPRRTQKGGQTAAARQSVPAQPAVPNGEVARVLRQVFAAKKIGQQVQLGVSNTLVELSGTVESEAELREILRLIEKARETRRVDASAVKIRP